MTGTADDINYYFARIDLNIQPINYCTAVQVLYVHKELRIVCA